MRARQFFKILIHKSQRVAIVISTTIFLLVNTTQAIAITTNPAPSAKISFTFDDGLASALTKAAPALAAYGMKGTEYITTSFIGQPGYMTWDQARSLRDNYGWEIGSHSVTHPLMTEISDAQKELEVSQSKTILEAQGFQPKSFATPYGDYDNAVIAAAARYYSSHRPFWDQNQNTWPYNDHLLYVRQVQTGVSVNTVKRYIDQAKKNKSWLILVFHDIKDVASKDPEDYEYSTNNLKQIAAYAKTVNIPSVNISDALVTSDANLMPNSTFDLGVTGGWTTDAPTLIKLNSATKGSYPSPLNSLELNTTTKNVHLFSPKISVVPTSTYLFKTFLNVEKISSGEVGYYLDEYDTNGNWVSGQYKKAERTAFVENINFTYKPTSTKVARVSLQIIVAANSGIKAYVDNVQLFHLN